MFYLLQKVVHFNLPSKNQNIYPFFYQLHAVIIIFI